MRLTNKLKVLILTFFVSFLFTAQLNAYTEIIRAEGTYNFPNFQQDASALRTDTILLALEGINHLDSVWIKFGGSSLYVSAPLNHPLRATYQDSLNIFLQDIYGANNTALNIGYRWRVLFISEPRVYVGDSLVGILRDNGETWFSQPTSTHGGTQIP